MKSAVFFACLALLCALAYAAKPVDSQVYRDFVFGKYVQDQDIDSYQPYYGYRPYWYYPQEKSYYGWYNPEVSSTYQNYLPNAEYYWPREVRPENPFWSQFGQWQWQVPKSFVRYYQQNFLPYYQETVMPYYQPTVVPYHQQYVMPYHHELVMPYQQQYQYEQVARV